MLPSFILALAALATTTNALTLRAPSANVDMPSYPFKSARDGQDESLHHHHHPPPPPPPSNGSHHHHPPPPIAKRTQSDSDDKSRHHHHPHPPSNGSHHHHPPPPRARRTQLISRDEMHARAMAKLPADSIIYTRDLEAFIARHAGTDKTAYLVDERAFVPMASVREVERDAGAVDKRQGTSPCTGGDTWYMDNAKQYWGAWGPASTCLWTGSDSQGGRQDIGWSKTVSITNDAKLEWTVIKDVIKGTLGFSVTNSWSKSGTNSCNVPGNSVGQVWIQNYLGAGDMYKQAYQMCSGVKTDLGGKTFQGGVTVPSDNSEGSGYALGCSTGQDKVQCQGS